MLQIVMLLNIFVETDAFLSKNISNCLKQKTFVTFKCLTHSDSSQQSLRDIGNDDADEEDDRLQPGVAQNEGQDEERHAQEDGHARDDLNEVLDLHVDGRLTHLQTGRQSRNAAHHRTITCIDHYAMGCTWIYTQMNQLMRESKKKKCWMNESMKDWMK